NRLYFVRRTPSEDYELWAYDGSSVAMIRWLAPTDDFWDTMGNFDMGIYKNALYFGVHGLNEEPYDAEELWRYDGQGQPVQVGVVALRSGLLGDLHVYKGKLYLTFHSEGLFRFDGSSVEKLPEGARARGRAAPWRREAGSTSTRRSRLTGGSSGA